MPSFHSYNLKTHVSMSIYSWYSFFFGARWLYRCQTSALPLSNILRSQVRFLLMLKISTYFMCMSALPACVCTVCMSSAHWGQKKARDPLELRATMKVLGFSGRVTSALNYWAISRGEWFLIWSFKIAIVMYEQMCFIHYSFPFSFDFFSRQGFSV